MPASKSSASPAEPLADALEKSENVKETVQGVADDLAVVHAVLDKDVPKERTDELDRAVQRTNDLEKKLSKSAEVLEQVTDTLSEELKKKGGS